MMDLPPNAWIEGVLWLLQVSFQAAIVVAAILVIRRLAGGRLSAQWRHALWFVLLLRLLLPWTPQSAVSLYQVVPNPVEALRTENPIPVAEPRLSPGMKTAEDALCVLFLDSVVGPLLDVRRERSSISQRSSRYHARGQATVLQLEGLNHLFQTARTGSPAEYQELGESMSPQALEAISKWMAGRLVPAEAKSENSE
jgi:hypothetical protein